MAINFDPDIGYIPKTEEQLRSEKRQRLEDRLGITINDSPNSKFSILNDASTVLDAEINQLLGLLIEEIENTIKTTSDTLTIPSSSTHKAITERFYDFVDELEFISIEDADNPNTDLVAGQIRLFLIFKEGQDHLNFPFEIWTAVHRLKASGIQTIGDFSVEFTAPSNQQMKQYFYSLGERVYVYIRTNYVLNESQFVSGDIDTRIIEIYQNVIDTKYRKISRGVEYQDFTTPTFQIDGIVRTDFYYYFSNNPNLDIGAIPLEDFTINQNTPILVFQALDFNLGGRIIIDRIAT